VVPSSVEVKYKVYKDSGNGLDCTHLKFNHIIVHKLTGRKSSMARPDGLSIDIGTKSS
jgi:hypothetical protein